MNPNGHHAMNGYPSNNGASTSSQNYNNEYPHPHPNQPLFNPNIPVQHQHQQHHQSQPMQQRNSQNQWQQHSMQPNPSLPPSHIAPQHQPPFNPAPWGNQIPLPQQFPNMLPMGNFNMPFLSQQIIQEAFSMSTPVEASDEPTLLTKLLSSRKEGQSYKDALNSLHGTNGHSASLWKDYYLDHKDRLDSWIAMCLQKDKDSPATTRIDKDVRRVSLPTAKKPSPASFKREPSPHVSMSRVSISAPAVKHPPKKQSHSTPPVAADKVPPVGRRNTMNSLSTPAPVFDARLPQPNADIRIPDPPSRSPSPPTSVIPHRGRGNKYTNDDREFFIKFVGWRLKQDPSLNRHDICRLLAEKAPHHTAQSWASHWSNNHDLPDKILAAARGDDCTSEQSFSSEEEKVAVRRRPKYKDTTTSEEESEESDSEDEEEDDDIDDKPLRQYSEKDMGGKGDPFNEADLYIAAKYIASMPHWDITTSKDRWEPFHEKYPHRSAKSWAEYYRRNENVFIRMAKKIKQQESGSQLAISSIHTQCARPTRTPPKSKRKFELDSSEETAVKRGRSDVERG